MAYLKLSLVLVMLVFCGSGLSGPIEGAKEELKLTDPGVPEALQAAYAELGKNSDARYRRLKALSVTRADLTGGSGQEYDFKMLEDRDCSKIDGNSPDACIQCNVFILDKPTETPRYTHTHMNCVV
ncbi:hypothetical protein M8J76_011453 [Diaphorina citri]|nr:hypothetical protein M8J76_011453 [Diaphorina citri]